MRKQILAILLKIDFLAVNPQLTQRARLRGKKEESLIFYLGQQIFLTSLIFIVVYGLTIFPIDFYHFPGLMSYYFLLFNGLALLQGIASINHLFFNEQGLKEYLPLPVTLQEIYLSKSLIALLNMAAYSLPCVLVFIDFGWYQRTHLVANLFLAFCLYVFLLLINYALVNLLLLLFTFIPKFAQYQKQLSQLLMITMTVLVVWSILYINQLNIHRHVRPIWLIYPMLHILRRPFSVESMTWFGILMGLTVSIICLMVWLSQYRLSRHQWQLLAANQQLIKKQKLAYSTRSLKSIIFVYHFRLVSDYRFCFQVLLASLIIPLIFIWQLAQRMPNHLFHARYSLLIALGGLFLSAYTIHPQSFIANLFSLERQNLPIMNQLPINQKKYLKQKFIFGLMLQLGINGLLYGLFLLKFPLAIANLLSGILGLIIGTFCYGSYYFIQDYLKPYLTWNDYFQLLNRKANGLKMLFLYGGQLLLQSLLLVVLDQALATRFFKIINYLGFGGIFLLSLVIGLLALKKIGKQLKNES